MRICVSKGPESGALGRQVHAVNHTKRKSTQRCTQSPSTPGRDGNACGWEGQEWRRWERAKAGRHQDNGLSRAPSPNPHLVIIISTPERGSAETPHVCRDPKAQGRAPISCLELQEKTASQGTMWQPEPRERQAAASQSSSSGERCVCEGGGPRKINLISGPTVFQTRSDWVLLRWQNSTKWFWVFPTTRKVFSYYQAEIGAWGQHQLAWK